MSEGNTKEQAMTNDELVSVLYQQLHRASDYATTALQENRKKAWDYYFNRPRGDEVAGRSRIQDTSVPDMVEALMAQIMPSYATDDLVTFEPMGPDDEDQSEAESLAVNNVFVEDNNGFLQLTNAIKAALLQRNGIIKVWMQDCTYPQTRRFPGGMDAETLAAVLAELPEEAEVDQDADGTTTVSWTETRRKLQVQAIEPAYMYLDPNQQDQNLQECPFVAERWLPTRSELVGLGVSKAKVDALPQLQDESVTTDTSTNLDITAKFIDGIVDIGGNRPHSQQMVECHWIHTWLDMDGDGEAERWRFLVSNREILLEDRVDYFPYASGTGWLVPFRWSGLSVYDKLKMTQDEATNARRQLADNMNIANNQRTWGVQGSVNLDDALRSRPGGHVRVRDPAAFGVIPNQDITMSSISYIQVLKEQRAEQAGAAIDLQQADDQLMKAGITAQSVDRQMSSREQVAEMVNRTLAETLVRGTMLLIHTCLRMDYDQPISFRHKGQWQTVDPSQWQERTRVNVNVGMSPGERHRKAQALSQILQTQLMLLQSGAGTVLVDTNSIYRTLIDLGKSMGVDGIQSYWIDPSSPQSLQAQQQMGEQSQQQAQMQQQMMQMQVQLEQQRVQIDQQKAIWDKEDKDFDNETDRLKLALDAEMKEAELVQQGVDNERNRQTAATQNQESGSGTGAAAN